MYLMILEGGEVSTVEHLPEDVVRIVDNGIADFVQFKDGVYERLHFEEVEGTMNFEARWEEI